LVSDPCLDSTGIAGQLDGVRDHVNVASGAGSIRRTRC
jgi:hypothetical protein